MTEHAAIQIRDLRTLDDCRAVVALQQAVWGADGETVPASVLLVSAKRGGLLIGAFTDNALVAFVWSLPGWRDAIQAHWSHMLGVLPAFRAQRLGERLKVAQRERGLAQGAELIEWTFDPLQAVNAHLNLHVLGAVGATYAADIYGQLGGPLHRGTPTDRLIVEWWIREPLVERRLSARQESSSARSQARGAPVLQAPAAIRTAAAGEWLGVAGTDATLTDQRILVPIPPRFLEMQQDATDLALAWRLALRDVMTSAFDRGYRAVDFHLNREEGGGRYLLAKP